MAAEARRRGAGHIRQMVIPGDGAAWIWNLAGQHFPEATQIVDLYHAREHLHDLARLLEFMLGDHKDDWLAARLAELDAGNIEAICAAARTFPLTGKKASDLQTALGYFEHNAHRMCYAHFRKLGMFTGSGAVEEGCKTIVAQRCKLSGMRWTLAAPTASSPCAAWTPAVGGKKPGPGPAGPTPAQPDPASEHTPHSDSPAQPKLPTSHLRSCPTPSARVQSLWFVVGHG